LPNSSESIASEVARRRCILPIDGFYEWRAIKGAKVKQPYAIAMKDRSPFGLAGLWENWKEPATGEWIRTFCIITVPANEMVSAIHDRMPAILKPGDYDVWLAGRQPSRTAETLPLGADDDVAYLNACELA
jgi:putative SOS response-associated peptidase YedK